MGEDGRQSGLFTQETAAKILCRLIGTNTSNPPGNENDLVVVIQALLREAGVAESDLHVLPHGDNRSSLILCLKGEDTSSTIGFAGHMDTVPPGNAAEWHSSPFAATPLDGHMFGRGAADMKGGLVAMLSIACYYAAR